MHLWILILLNIDLQPARNLKAFRSPAVTIIDRVIQEERRERGTVENKFLIVYFFILTWILDYTSNYYYYPCVCL